jgi:hypothetical protein
MPIYIAYIYAYIAVVIVYALSGWQHDTSGTTELTTALIQLVIENCFHDNLHSGQPSRKEKLIDKKSCGLQRY